jgi:ribosomal protein S18 acetylase RimI-like enzyme
MLVKLYDLPSLEEALQASSRQGVTIRRAQSPEKPIVTAWVRANFPISAAEVEAAFCRLPISCFIAVRVQQILGFACYDATARNFFGPEAVVEEARGRGLGRSLLLAALHAQREQGYAYAIIGGVGPAEFYAKTVGAIPIPDSTPGTYAGMLSLKSPAA